MPLIIANLEGHGIELPTTEPPGFNVKVEAVDGLHYLVTAELELDPADERAIGCVGGNVDLASAQTLAVGATIHGLGALHRAVGLDNVTAVLGVSAWIASARTFTDHDAVISSPKALFRHLWGPDVPVDTVAVLLNLRAPVEIQFLASTAPPPAEPAPGTP